VPACQSPQERPRPPVSPPARLRPATGNLTRNLNAGQCQCHWQPGRRRPLRLERSRRCSQPEGQAASGTRARRTAVTLPVAASRASSPRRRGGRRRRRRRRRPGGPRAGRILALTATATKCHSPRLAVAGGPGSESAPAGPRRAGSRLGVCRGQRLPRLQHGPGAPLTRSTSQWQVAPDSAPTPSRGRGRGRLLRPRTSLGHLLNELLIECQSEQAAMVSILVPVDDSRDMRSCPLALASSPCHGPETCDSLVVYSVDGRGSLAVGTPT
jgi:hypothetical protein